MPEDATGRQNLTFQNPVYRRSFPDPFVLKFKGKYFAYCTGHATDGNVFGVLRSHDLVRWEEIGGAMSPLDPSPPYYWAPEVTYDNGKFYLYYSTGNETLMEIRVAVSTRPDGGFIDSGHRLTDEDFAIDAHVFIDDDGARYMFYATDFLTHTHIGTGTVVDRMVDWFTLEGRPRVVTRARYDWQVYDPARKEKGGVRWHTVEGPAVLKRKDRYFEMFSGGNWQNKTYGVSFAVADDLAPDGEWHQFSDGEKVLPILRTIPDQVIGPGHNCVVRGPNNRELYCIYHRWTDDGRVMAIDRMDFAGNRIFVAGPTTMPQPAPFRPAVPAVGTTGFWTKHEDGWISSSHEACELEIALPGSEFLCECTFRCLDADGRAGFRLRSYSVDYEFEILAAERRAVLTSAQRGSVNIALPADFDPAAYHLLRIEAGMEKLRVTIGTPNLAATIDRERSAKSLVFFADATRVEFAALQITPGFEELFESAGKMPPGIALENGRAEISNSLLRLEPNSDSELEAHVRIEYPEFELAVNVATLDKRPASFGIRLKDIKGSRVGTFTIGPDNGAWSMELESARDEGLIRRDLIDAEFSQIRMVSQGNSVTAFVDGVATATLPGAAEVSSASIFSDSPIAVDMVRVTAI